MSTPNDGSSTASPAAAAAAPAPVNHPPARQLGDLALLLLAIAALLAPLMSAESPGTVLLNLLLAVAGLLTVLHDLVLRRPWRASLPLLCALLCWIAGVLVASYGGQHAAGLNLLLVRWSGFAVAASAAHRLTADADRRRLLLVTLVCAGWLLAVYGLEEIGLERPVRIAQFDTDPLLQSAAAADVRSLGGQERYFNPRIAGTFISANLMGAAYGLGALWAFGAAWRLWRRRWVKAATLTATAGALMAIGLLLTGSKGALLGLACGGLVAVVAARAMGAAAGRFRRYLPPALAAGLLGGMLLLPAVAGLVAETHAPDFSAAGESTGAAKSAWVRVDYWQTGWRMWRDHPVGIGPDQTQQFFSQYRSRWALETPVDLHHEAFEMLVECGPAAALGWIGLFAWLLVAGWRRLREEAALPPPPSPAVGDSSTAPPSAEPLLFLPLSWMVGLALVAAWLLCATVGFFDGNRQIDPVRIGSDLSSPWTGLRLAYFAAALAAVLLSAWLVIQSRRLFGEAAAAATAPVGRAVLWGALVGLLAHSGFDFVLQNHALLTWAGLLAGLLTAAAPEAAAVPAPAPVLSATPRERLRRQLPAVALAFCASILLWLGVVQPLRLALAQSAAERIAHAFEQLPLAQAVAVKHPGETPNLREQIAQVGPDLIAARQAVLALTPEDYEAVVDYHLALIQVQQLNEAAGLPPLTVRGLGGVPRTIPEELLNLAAAYIAANPQDPTRWFYAGRLYLSLGDLQDREKLRIIEGTFAEAARLDPRRPLLHLMVGDCRLAAGDRAGAAQAYRAAWQAQARTSMPEVQFFCLYYDANLEIVPPPETGMDATFVRQPQMLLHEFDQVDPETQAALLRRYWVALRAVTIAAPAMSTPTDPQRLSDAERKIAADHLLWRSLEKQTLDRLLLLRPGSVDTQLLITLHEIATAPPGRLTDADMSARFADLKQRTLRSTVDPLLPGTIERIEAAVRFPPRLRYAPPPPR